VFRGADLRYQPPDLGSSRRRTASRPDPHPRAWRYARAARAAALVPARSRSLPSCRGAGQVRRCRVRSPSRRPARAATAKRGSIIPNPCDRCGGTGASSCRRRLSVKIGPASTRATAVAPVRRRRARGVNSGPHGVPLCPGATSGSHRCSSATRRPALREWPGFLSAPRRSACEIDIRRWEGTAHIRVPAEMQTGKIFRLKGKASGRAQPPCRATVLPTWWWKRHGQPHRAPPPAGCRRVRVDQPADSARHNPPRQVLSTRVKEFFRGLRNRGQSRAEPDFL